MAGGAAGGNRRARTFGGADALNERIAIVGAGLAGLSLALQLQRDPNFRGHVVLFEARSGYTDDRRWSFWPLRGHPFVLLPAQRMSSLRFAAEGDVLCIDCDAAPYTSLAAGDVYAHAQALLHEDPCFSLRFATPVHALREATDHVEVEYATVAPGAEHTNAVQIAAESGFASERFDRVFDGRLPEEAWRFAQWFTGAELTVPAGATMPEPVFMDFGVRLPGEIAFAYVLPQGVDRVLVQLTWFLPRGAEPPTDARTRWARYVSDTLALDPAVIVREESGVVPMHLWPAQTSSKTAAVQRIHRIGTAAGWVRASTGYGFLDTQRASARLAQALCANDDARARTAAIAAVRPRAGVDDRLDAILLEAMRAQPDAVAAWFLRLFQRCPTPQLMRFLSGEAGALDRFAVMRALPPMPFLRAAWRTRGGRA
jgi:lycopene beta-cyclase